MGYAQEDIKPYDANAPKGEQVEREIKNVKGGYMMSTGCTMRRESGITRKILQK